MKKLILSKIGIFVLHFSAFNQNFINIPEPQVGDVVVHSERIPVNHSDTSTNGNTNWDFSYLQPFEEIQSIYRLPAQNEIDKYPLVNLTLENINGNLEFYELTTDSMKLLGYISEGIEWDLNNFPETIMHYPFDTEATYLNTVQGQSDQSPFMVELLRNVTTIVVGSGTFVSDYYIVPNCYKIKESFTGEIYVNDNLYSIISGYQFRWISPDFKDDLLSISYDTFNDEVVAQLLMHDGALSIDINSENVTNFTLYPSLVTVQDNIQLTTSTISNYLVEISNEAGELIYKSNFYDISFNINTDELIAGRYFVRLLDLKNNTINDSEFLVVK